jgi:hypothetical protein
MPAGEKIGLGCLVFGKRGGIVDRSEVIGHLLSWIESP